MKRKASPRAPAIWPPVSGCCYVCGMDAENVHSDCDEWLDGWRPPASSRLYTEENLRQLLRTGWISDAEYKREIQNRRDRQAVPLRYALSSSGTSMAEATEGLRRTVEAARRKLEEREIMIAGPGGGVYALEVEQGSSRQSLTTSSGTYWLQPSTKMGASDSDLGAYYTKDLPYLRSTGWITDEQYSEEIRRRTNRWGKVAESRSLDRPSPFPGKPDPLAMGWIEE